MRDPGVPMQISYDEAECFLSALDPNTDRFTFQTFDDNKDRKDGTLARVLHGTLRQRFDELSDLNNRGAGVFVTVNETDFKGRSASNITRVRALFIDLDGARLDPVFAKGPHIITKTSPGRWHAYWLVAPGMPLTEFACMQKRLAAHFHADPSVHDLPRVIRLPGFVHRKGAPFVSLLLQTNDELPPYDWKELEKAFKPIEPEEPKSKLHAPLRDDADMSERWRQLNSEALANPDAWVPSLCPGARRTQQGYRVTSKDLHRDLEEDLSFHVNGIKDFGVHDMGDPRGGRRTPIDVVMKYLPTDFDGAAAWLARALGRDPKNYQANGARKFNGGTPNEDSNGAGAGGNAAGPVFDPWQRHIVPEFPVDLLP